MPTFTAIALERLLEHGSRNPAQKPPPLPITVKKAAQETTVKKSIPRPNISPALYATPETTPLPDSPSSFRSDSPYLINHKRRGPRLVKSLLQKDACGGGQPKRSEGDQNVEAVNGNGHDTEELKAGNAHACQGGSLVDEFSGGEVEDANLNKGMIAAEELVKPLSDNPERDEDADDFFDMQSNASNSEVDDTYGRWKPSTPLGEYYDALEGMFLVQMLLFFL